MNIDNIKVNLSRILKNQNTLTFVLVIGLIVVIYFVYTGMVNQSVQPTALPYATELLKEKREITDDVINIVKVSGTFTAAVGDDLIQSKGQLREKYVNVGYQIPQNSFFYKSAITTIENTNKTGFEDMPDDYTPFSLAVDFNSTYGCSIMPGNYIDIFLKAEIDRKIVYELFIKSIRVEQVVDKDGNNVFTNTDDNKKPQPKYLIFTVPTEYKELLEMAMMISNVELYPVPRNAGYSENPENTILANESLRAYIIAQSKPIVN